MLKRSKSEFYADWYRIASNELIRQIKSTADDATESVSEQDVIDSITMLSICCEEGVEITSPCTIQYWQGDGDPGPEEYKRHDNQGFSNNWMNLKVLETYPGELEVYPARVTLFEGGYRRLLFDSEFTFNENIAMGEYDSHWFHLDKHGERILHALESYLERDEVQIKHRPTASSNTPIEETTLEALLMQFKNQPQGILGAYDELATFFGNFDKYRAGSGDMATYLKIFGVRSIVVDRKTGDHNTIYIDKPFLSITGGIQEKTLRRYLGAKERESGLAARFLFSMPPKKLSLWSEQRVDPKLIAEVQRIYDGLYDLYDPEKPKVIKLSEEASKRFRSFYDSMKHQIYEMHSSDVESAYAKLIGYAGRFALVLHLVKWAKSRSVDLDEVDAATMDEAIELIGWFKDESERIYAYLDGTGLTQQEEKLVESIREQGGSITPRELHRMDRGTWPDTEAAEKKLNDLTERGLGNWKTEDSGSDGGRPSRKFTLFE